MSTPGQEDGTATAAPQGDRAPDKSGTGQAARAKARDKLTNGTWSRKILRADILRLLKLLAPHRTDLPLIRLGDFGDGGYLVPDDLQGIAALFSPGVAQVASFEMDVAKRGIPIYLADASVEAPPVEIPGSEFLRCHLGPITRERSITLGDWVAEYAPADETDGDLMLQMDIEGHEYAVLAATPDEVLKRFRIITIEMHRAPSFENPGFYDRVVGVLHRLHRHFLPVHVHPNNCCGLPDVCGVAMPRVFEVTYLRRDRVSNPRPERDLPHLLDRPNVAGRPDLALPDEWLLG